MPVHDWHTSATRATARGINELEAPGRASPRATSATESSDFSDLVIGAENHFVWRQHSMVGCALRDRTRGKMRGIRGNPLITAFVVWALQNCTVKQKGGFATVFVNCESIGPWTPLWSVPTASVSAFGKP